MAMPLRNELLFFSACLIGLIKFVKENSSDLGQ